MLPALRNPRFTLPTLPVSSILRREVDDLFGNFFSDYAHEDTGIMGGWTTPVAVWEDESHIYVELEIPGIGSDDVEVLVQRGNLRISGMRKVTDENKNYWHNERFYGKSERVISLPDVVDPEFIQAKMRDGILSVILAKKPEAQPKKVCIT